VQTEYSLVKKPHQKQTYTKQQVQEFVRCADPVTGPLYFMSNYFYVQHPVKGKMLYQPYEYQVDLIATYHNYRFSINLLSRQMGKSVTAAGYLLWYAMFRPDSTILIAAHKYTGAQEIMQRVRYAYELCPDHIRAGSTSYNKGSIDFENGSRIVAQTTTETTGRGMSISLLYSDEFAFVRPTIAREFWTSISPTLSTGGKAIITSTPNSDEDQFSEIWKLANKCVDEYGNETNCGINGFKAFKSEWWQHPDRDEKWKAEELGRIGEERFRREHGLEFITYEETLINSLFLPKLEGVQPLIKQGQVRWFKEIDPTATYVVGLDPSLGTGRDPAAIEIFEIPSCEQVGEWQHNKTPVQTQIKILSEIVSYIADVVKSPSQIYYSIENNTIGEAALVSLEEYGEERIRGIFLSEPTGKNRGRRYRKGFTTTHTSKITACAKFKSLVENNKLIIRSKNLISEIKNFVSVGTTYRAKPGETDDLVMATLLVVRMIVFLQNFDPGLDEKLRDAYNEEFIAPLPFVII
jgi:hypothetical protein